MECSCPNCSQGFLWFRFPSSMDKDLKQFHHVVKSSHNPHTPMADRHFRPMYVNTHGHIERDQGRNNTMYRHQNDVRNEHIKRNIHGSIRRLVNCNFKPPSYCVKEIYVPSSSTFETDNEHHLKTSRDSQFGLPSHLSRSYKYVHNSLDVESLWSEIEDIVFSDDNDYTTIKNPQRSLSFRGYTDTSLASRKHRGSQSIQRSGSVSNTLPIKGILKSSSQSSYSSFGNEMGSDGEATASNNSQRSSESSSLGSKTSKKKVHFEERVITKIILPLCEYALYNDSVFQNEAELVTIDNMAIQPDCHSAHNSENNDVTKPDPRINDCQQGHSNNHIAGNNRETASDIKMGKDSIVNGLHDKTTEFTNNFNGERGESEIVFPNHSFPSKVPQYGHNGYDFPPSYFLTRDKLHGLKYGSNTTLTEDVDKKCSLKIDECRTAFPYRPLFEFPNFHLGTRVHDKKIDGQCERGKKKLFQNSIDDKHQIDFTRVKFLQAKSLSPQDKTERILEWLDDVKDNGRPKTNNVSFLVIPRPLMRRGSFVGE